MMRAAVFVLLISTTFAKDLYGSYDYIIVGGGAAGAVLANRLSESGKHSVLLLNVAGAPPDAYNGPVLLSDEFIVKKNLTATQGLQLQIMQPGYSMKAFPVSKTGSSPARWLGGSTLPGLSLYLRDHPEILDEWGGGWSWKEMRSYFHKVENLVEACSAYSNKSCGDYGTSGVYHIAKEPAYTHPLTNDFIAAAQAAGFPKGDLNTLHGKAVGLPATTQYEDGTKVHAYNAYLYPALGRRNLKVLDGARADRLIMHGRHCKGVVLVRRVPTQGGIDLRWQRLLACTITSALPHKVYRELATKTDHVLHANREVILSAGYVYTPRLLFLSGIGPKRELDAVGLPVLHDLPAMGKHVTSARYSPLSWKTDKPSLTGMFGPPISSIASELPDAYQSTAQEAFARYRSTFSSMKRPLENRSDVVFSFLPMYQALESAPLQFSLQGEPWPLQTNGYTILVTLGETEADGEITFPTASPDVSPVLTHRPLTDQDWKLAKEAVAYAMTVWNKSALGGTFIDNGAGRRDAFSAVYDGRGSCRMGRHQNDSVVDFNLRIHGVQGLRIVDGSVIPQPSPYFALPEVLALAERAADLILKTEQHEVENQNHGVEKDRKKPALETISIERLKRECGKSASLYEMLAWLEAHYSTTKFVK